MPAKHARRPGKRDERRRGRRDPLHALLSLTESLTENVPLEESLRAVTDTALRVLPANHASIRLLDGSQSELLSGARSGEGTSVRPMTFRRGQGVIGWVVDRSEGICIDDVEKDLRFSPGKQAFAIRSMLAEPLLSGGQVIGVLSLTSKKRRAFGVEDRLLARLLANCCTPPIERARLRRLAMTDDLTLAYNQRYLSPRVNEEIERARRTGQPLSVALIDLDHFKEVNDQHGHDVGDAVLRLVADRMRATVRRVDVLIRRGGEEFLLLMPATSLEQARKTAERIRRAVGSADVDAGAVLPIHQTVSVGVATWDFKEVPEALLRRADATMYSAKEQGRDRVVASAPPPTLLRVVR